MGVITSVAIDGGVTSELEVFVVTGNLEPGAGR